jgi:DNA-binding NarL/FixJ family response regulator
MNASRHRPILTRMLSADRQVSILVATGRPATRTALTALLDSEPGVRAAGAARDLPSAIRMIRSRRPDVVLVDRTVLGPAAAGTLTMLTAAAPDVAVYLVGMGDHPQMDAYARCAGAAGYLRLDETPERLSGTLMSAA